MLLAGKDRDLGIFPAGEGRVQDSAQPLALARRDAARPPVGDQPALECREVAPGDEVAFPHLDVRAERLEDAAAEDVAERVVAEEAQVGRPAAGRDAHQHGVRQAARAQAVDHEEDDLGIRLDGELF